MTHTVGIRTWPGRRASRSAPSPTSSTGRTWSRATPAPGARDHRTARLRAQRGARQLRAGSSRIIAMLVLDMANPFFVTVAQGAERAARTPVSG
ncbi:hypothetical protein NKH77_54535 [Streptomyces sp. M19]